MAITKNKIQIKEKILEKELRNERTITPWGSYIYGWDYYEDGPDYYYRYEEYCSGSYYCGCTHCTGVEYETVYVPNFFGEMRRLVIPGGKEYKRKSKIDSLLREEEISEPISDIHYKLKSVGLVA